MILEQEEFERLRELDSFSILDTIPEEDYDNLTALASSICETPISLVSLIDLNRQWFKSNYGLDVRETPREYAFCAHAIQQPKELFYVRDAREDDRFSNNPLVTGEPYIAFYAGVPILSEKGNPLGTLCVIDKVPRDLTDGQMEGLKALALQVMKLLALRKSRLKLRLVNKTLQEKNNVLRKFADVAAISIDSPLQVIKNTCHDFLRKHEENIDIIGLEMISSMRDSANQLSMLIKAILTNATLDDYQPLDIEEIPTTVLCGEILKLYPITNDLQLEFFFKMDSVTTNKAMLIEILSELVTNGVRHNDKQTAEIVIGGSETDSAFEFYVSDNGRGLTEEELDKVFDVFTVLNPVGRYGEYGAGIGLAHVKRLVNELSGEIEITSQENEGTMVTFSIAK